ncbi:MAG: helix-turn-helix transcriptional regulator [bacterium]
MVPESITNALLKLIQHHASLTVRVACAIAPPPALSHVVNFPRLEIPIGGVYENEIEQNGKPVILPMRFGEALFVPPNCWNRPTWRRPVRVLSILFGKRQIGISLVIARGDAPENLHADKFAIPNSLGAPALAVMDALMELHRHGGPATAYPDLVRALSRCCQEMLLKRDCSPEPGQTNRLMESIQVYLQNNYQYEVTRDSTARQFGISPNHLSRLFRMHGHISFSRYLTYVRMDRAKHLLKTYPIKLEEVALRCGYRNAPYFCRVFGRIVKQPPSSFRPDTGRLPRS